MADLLQRRARVHVSKLPALANVDVVATRNYNTISVDAVDWAHMDHDHVLTHQGLAAMISSLTDGLFQQQLQPSSSLVLAIGYHMDVPNACHPLRMRLKPMVKLSKLTG